MGHFEGLSRSAVLLAAMVALAACAQGSDDGQAQRQSSVTGVVSAQNGSPQSIGVGPVTCAGGEIYVANSAANTIAVFDRTASGSAAPLRIVAGPTTGLVTPDDTYAPRAVAVDGSHDELFATAGKSILVYARNASGDEAPLRSIAGASTGLSLAGKLAVDLVHDEILVVDSGRVLVFARTASGNVAPLRTLTVSNPSAVALDLTNDEIAVARSYPASVVVYARTASGAATPLRDIEGAVTGLTEPVALAVDAAHDEIVAINYVNYGTNSSASVFSRTATGNVAPLRTISGPDTGVYNPYGVVVDAGQDEILVVNAWGANRITAFPRTASGDVVPLRTLSGSTGLVWPWDLSLLPQTVYCPQGTVCAAGGCMPAGSVDCADGHYCPSGALCNWPPNATTCTIPGAPSMPAGAEICRFGTACPSGQVCASGGCMPTGGVDCGGGFHCASGSTCSWDYLYCVPEGGDDCQNGRYCSAGYLCNSGGLYCMPPGVVSCGDGYYCPSGKVCELAETGIACKDPAPPPGGGGGGGAYCYSTSACIPSSLSPTCECAGATTPGQCVSGHPACSGTGGPCGDGVHACCAGETCIYNQCVAGCGQCAGKGCRL